ncbi:hypothetical protein D3C76_1422130 [compost metagenome]
MTPELKSVHVENLKRHFERLKKIQDIFQDTDKFILLSRYLANYPLLQDYSKVRGL